MEYLLPTAARELLTPLRGRRLVRVRRVVHDPEAEATTRRDPADGPIELALDDGAVLHAIAEPGKSSVVLCAGELPPSAGPAVDVSRNDFWRWRLRREITGVVVWKSLDVDARASELEFGLELELRFTPSAVLEYVVDQGVESLIATDGKSGERCRHLRLV